MYTTVAGPEVTYTTSSFIWNVGLYAGSASREEVSGRFLGAQIGMSRSFGSLELSLSHFAGLIHTPGDPSSLGNGTYHHSGFEVSLPLNLPQHFPMTLTASIERRYFNFGNGGPRNDMIDTYIFVLGAEIAIAQ
jgi:hypothetical protein